MPVNKYLSFEDARRDLWVLRPDADYYRKLRDFYAFAVRLHKPHFPNGLVKFKNMEEANGAREFVDSQAHR
jgi:hypothetical protein